MNSGARQVTTSTWKQTALLAAGLAVVLAVLLTAFAWPASRSRPRDIPLAIAGPASVTTEVTEVLQGSSPGSFALQPVNDANAARRAVVNRDVDGAVVLTATGPEIIIATQASPAVAQLITQLGTTLATDRPLSVDDVAPAPPTDSRGAGLAAGALPLALAAAIAGVAITALLHGRSRQGAAAVLFAILGGLAAVGVLHAALGTLNGNWFAEVGVMTLGLTAITTALIGADAVGGRVGLAIVELTIIVLGNPLSAASTAPSMLPDGWSQVGQALPPGAMVSALRSVAAFDGTGSAGPLMVLALWTVGGFTAFGVSGTRAHHRSVTARQRLVSRSDAA